MNPHHLPSLLLRVVWPPCRHAAALTIALLALGIPQAAVHAQAQNRAKVETQPRGEEVFPKDAIRHRGAAG